MCRREQKKVGPLDLMNNTDCTKPHFSLSWRFSDIKRVQSMVVLNKSKQKPHHVPSTDDFFSFNFLFLSLPSPRERDGSIAFLWQKYWWESLVTSSLFLTHMKVDFIDPPQYNISMQLKFFDYPIRSRDMVKYQLYIYQI